MGAKMRVLHICPYCGKDWFASILRADLRRCVGLVSLVDGQVYPSCGRYYQLCRACTEKRWDSEGVSCMKIPDPAGKNGDHGGSKSNAMVPGPLREFLELLAFLSGFVSETGGGRAPGNLSLKLQSGLWGVTLNDAETGQYCFVQGANLDDLLVMIELGLGDGGLPWRPSTFQAKKRK